MPAARQDLAHDMEGCTACRSQVMPFWNFSAGRVTTRSTPGPVGWSDRPAERRRSSSTPALPGHPKARLVTATCSSSTTRTSSPSSGGRSRLPSRRSAICRSALRLQSLRSGSTANFAKHRDRPSIREVARVVLRGAADREKFYPASAAHAQATRWGAGYRWRRRACVAASRLQAGGPRGFGAAADWLVLDNLRRSMAAGAVARDRPRPELIGGLASASTCGGGAEWNRSRHGHG